MYCIECGTKLTDKFLEHEGIVPYCEKCGEFRFPPFSTACSMIVLDPSRERILLIKQYGRDRNILVAGYISKGEDAEHAARREVKEETGIDITELHYNKSGYFERSNTLMLNFWCVAASDDLSHTNYEIDSAAWYTFEQAKEKIVHGSLAEKFLLYFLEHQAASSC